MTSASACIGGEESGLDASVYRKIVTDMADAVIGMDRAHVIRLCNPAAEALFGWTEQEMIGQPVNMLIPHRYHDLHPQRIDGFSREGQDARYMGNRSGFILGVNREGDEICLGATILHIRNESQPLMVAIIRDLTERQAHQSELQRLASTDPLSGALNRRAFREAAEAKIREARLRNHDSALLLFDIDHFKRINDIHGHEAGDRVICEFTGFLRASLRSNDVMGRWGGEEFIVCLPAASLEQAASVGERIRQTVESARFVVSTQACLQLTVSAGVSHENGDGTLDDLIRRADIALYAAKANGRNRLFMFAAGGQEASALS